MQFNSYIFILLYLPVMVTGYFVLNRFHLLAGKVFLILMSAVFYIYGGLNIAVITGASILLNYLLVSLLEKAGTYKKALLVSDIAANVLLLFYFKYFNFLLETLNGSLGTDYTLRNIILPLGISFLTFQQIMYAVNVYKKDIQQVNVLDYLAYILYFPKVLMGPLVEPADLIAQINDPALKKVNWDNIASGLKTFSYGLFKKMLLADTFSAAVSWGFSNVEAATAMDCFLVMLSYTFEIYFDFSGYSDMATAVSHMLNIRLPINFDSPYKALSIRDFWKRWHISLTGFLTKYIYIPLGGSKKGKARTYLNTMIVFLVSGIWHGANWTFLLWGAIHGILSVFDRIFENKKRNLMEAVRWAGTFFAVNLLWLLFRADSIAQWGNILAKMFTFQDMNVSSGLLAEFLLPEISILLQVLHLSHLHETVRGFNLAVFVAVSFFLCLVPANNYKKLQKNNWISMVFAAIAFVWAFLCLSGEAVFVYFSF